MVLYKCNHIPHPSTSYLCNNKSGNGVRGTNSENRGKNTKTQEQHWEKHEVKPPQWNNSVHLISAFWLRFNSPEVQRPRFHLLLPKGKYRLTAFISGKLLHIFTAANWSNVYLLCLTPSLWGEKLLKASLRLNASSNLLGWTCEDKLLFFASGKNVCI